MTTNEINNQVLLLLNEAGVVFQAEYAGERFEKDWGVAGKGQTVDAYCVSFGSYETDFFQGLGHRTKRGKPVAPTAASVLYCLLSDSEAAGETFEDWCLNYGYDSDSRKAERIYFQCQQTATGLRKVFTGEQLKELKTLLQDY